MMRAKRVAIVQSNYIPWKGYFDLINSVDEFILFDDRQYTKRDWRNRNRIKASLGPRWLTIPIAVKGRSRQRIDEALVSDPGWAERHWQTLVHNYSKARYFPDLRRRIAGLYAANAQERRLSAINRSFLEAICAELGIQTSISWSTDHEAAGDRTERLVSLCRSVGATEYVSGPRARAYLDESRFASAGMTLSYISYDGYPEHPQLFPPFDHHVTILDLLFNVGPEAPRYLKSFRARERGAEMVHPVVPA